MQLMNINCHQVAVKLFLKTGSTLEGDVEYVIPIKCKFFLNPGPIGIEPHQRAGGRGHVGGGDGVD